jgi:hypothetical protein
VGISKRKRMAVAAELPPKAPHHTKIKMAQRALTVARNSEKGLWSRYAVGQRPTLETYAGRLRRHEAWQGYGRLEVEYRPMPSGTRWAMWVRFPHPTSTKFTEHLAASVADLGEHMAWEDGDPDDPNIPTADEMGEPDLPMP